MSSVRVRPAEPGDAGLIFALVQELAVYEMLENEVIASSELLATALFGPQPKVFCDIVDCDGAAAGFALWFYNFSTFVGRHGIYLEDLFVRDEYRGRGLGWALLRHLARRCNDEGLARLDWSVLDWNQPAIEFYRRNGAVLLADWTTCRLTGPALQRLAEAEPAAP